MNGDEDTVLVRDFKNGNEKAFDRLFEKYQISLYSICYRFTRNESDARELTQDIFIKIYNNLNKFDEIGRIMGITTGAAKANHHHAIRKLRVFMKGWI
jgi:RNA polymerase sigma-70 factor (ECF subfamily)